MHCVVCQQPVRLGHAHYANEWERTRQCFPCCSRDCSERFNPDEHWIPAVAPEAAEYAEEQRLIKVARRRIIDDVDQPSVVIREMLLAGVGIPALRKILNDGEMKFNETEAAVKKDNRVGLIMGILLGSWRVSASRYTDTDRTSVADGLADLDAWVARFGSPSR